MGQDVSKENEEIEALSPRSKSVTRSLSDESYFSDVEVSKLYKVFQSVSKDGKEALDRNQFEEALSLLKDSGFQEVSNSPFIDRLFETLDTDKNGKLDLKEFVSGLSLLCKGSLEEKLKLSFECYDIDGNGFIDKDELAEMFRYAWTAGINTLKIELNIKEKHGDDKKKVEESKENIGEFSDEMAQLFAESAFEALDTNKDGLLSFEEFREFALAEPKITATLNGFQRDVPITFNK